MRETPVEGRRLREELSERERERERKGYDTVKILNP